MRTILHISDLHFGRTHWPVVEPLVGFAWRLGPDLVVVSGDLTQRARSAQFREARAFLDALPGPQVVVPGNHDVPLHNFVARLAQPLDKYRRFITDDLEPFFGDDEIAVLGLNTAHGLTIKGGLLTRRDAERIRARFCASPRSAVRILVTHHPLDVPEGHSREEVARGARGALETLTACGADVVLAGHLHSGYARSAVRRVRHGLHASLLVQAGTATSTRGRGEANSFNVLRVDGPLLEVENCSWRADRGAFEAAPAERFERSAGGWRRA